MESIVKNLNSEEETLKPEREANWVQGSHSFSISLVIYEGFRLHPLQQRALEFKFAWY